MTLILPQIDVRVDFRGKRVGGVDLGGVVHAVFSGLRGGPVYGRRPCGGAVADTRNQLHIGVLAAEHVGARRCLPTIGDRRYRSDTDT